MQECTSLDFCSKCNPEINAIMNDHKYLCPICQKDELASKYNNDDNYNYFLWDGNYSKYKECTKCHRICCLNCIAITGCQCVHGICTECFDYKCEKCGN